MANYFWREVFGEIREELPHRKLFKRKHKYAFDYVVIRHWQENIRGVDYDLVGHWVRDLKTSEIVDIVVMGAPIVYADADGNFDPEKMQENIIMWMQNDATRYPIRKDMEHRYRCKVAKYQYHDWDPETQDELIFHYEIVQITWEEFVRGLERDRLPAGELTDEQRIKLLGILHHNPHLCRFKIRLDERYGRDTMDHIFSKFQ
ncbi:MAG: hypothetical protein WAN89_04100 [Lawsonella sp.]